MSLDKYGMFAYGDNSRPRLIVKDGSVEVTHYRISDIELEQLCREFNLDYNEIEAFVQPNNKGIHTIMIDVPTYLAAKKEK